MANKKGNIRDLKTIRILVISAAFLALILLDSQKGIAQDKSESIRVDTNLVLVNVLVYDKDGKPVKGIRADQFEVWDNEEKRPIESFSVGDAPISFGIVYDLHPTTAARTHAVIESLRQFKSGMNPNDDIFLVAFNMYGQQTFDFIPTFEQLETHIAPPAKREPYSLYDAIYLASERIRSSANQKRILVIISDSADHKSRHKLSEIRDKANEVKAEIYAAIFDEADGYGYLDVTHRGKENFPFSGDASALDRAAMVDLTIKTGGATYFGSSQNAFRLLSIYKQIEEEMRSHYTLGFYPEAIDENRHNLRVKLRNVKDAKEYALNYPSTYQNRRRPISQ
jgi:VWFA-related protein